mgnify:CR=1 FL=1
MRPSGAKKKFLKGVYQMSMTKYERAKVAEFYGDVVADILSSFLSAAEEKEKCRPGVGAPKAADNDDVLYSISHRAENVKYNERGK